MKFCCFISSVYINCILSCWLIIQLLFNQYSIILKINNKVIHEECSSVYFEGLFILSPLFYYLSFNDEGISGFHSFDGEPSKSLFLFLPLFLIYSHGIFLNIVNMIVTGETVKLLSRCKKRQRIISQLVILNDTF